MSDIVERARLVQRVNAHWSDSICECEECTNERFGLITPMADEIERLNEQTLALVREVSTLRGRLAEAERNEGTLLGMIRHQRDVLRECLPYINESMAGRRPGRCADDIRAAVKALTADSGDERNG